MQSGPDAKRLWMSDICFRWGGGGGLWSYNHGFHRGSSFYGNGQRGAPQFAGMNEMFGDGHVVWKPRGEFDVSAMDRLDRTKCAFVYTVPNGTTGDASFY
jgi:hypothetical protein